MVYPPPGRMFICSIFVDLFTRRPGYRVFILSIVVIMFTQRPGYRVFLSMFTFALSLCLYALPAARRTGYFISSFQSFYEFHFGNEIQCFGDKGDLEGRWADGEVAGSGRGALEARHLETRTPWSTRWPRFPPGTRSPRPNETQPTEQPPRRGRHLGHHPRPA